MIPIVVIVAMMTICRLAGGEPVAAGVSAARLAEVGPRFTEPSDDPAYVMPVGTGDLSAMLRYGKALEIHLSKTDFFGYGEVLSKKTQLPLSPGHVQLSFGIERPAIREFDQRLDYARGSVVLTIRTEDGVVKAEAFGLMKRNTLAIAVEDSRRTPHAAAIFSTWRPDARLSGTAGTVVTREVHDYADNNKPPTNPAAAIPADKMYHLGCSTAVAFADDRGILPAANQARSTLRLDTVPARYWLFIATATTYDTQPEAAAAALLDAAVKADKGRLVEEHLVWWRRFWDDSFLDLHGSDSEWLMRIWHTQLYSYASVGYGPVPPKFNGGPGLIVADLRSWGIGYWWQNQREAIWPLGAANHPDLQRAALDFYDRTFDEAKAFTAKQGKLGIRLNEWVGPYKPGTQAPAKTVSQFDADALEKAVADHTLENVKSGYNARSICQSAELVQQMFDYVAFTGDKQFLREVCVPWLKETTLFWLSHLRKGEDGLYHSMVSDAAEMWWKIKDPAPDMAAVRYVLWMALNHGEAMSFEPGLLAAVRERVEHLAPLPVGLWKRRIVKTPPAPPATQPIVQVFQDIDRTADQFAPGGDVYDDQHAHNAETPELYIVYPFGVIDAHAPAEACRRAVNTFRKRGTPNRHGWSQCPVQAARLWLDEAVDVIVDHARRHQKYPYGGWNSPGSMLEDSTTGATVTPYFDAGGVSTAAIQETLLQSHRLTTAEKADLLGGGPIVLIPAVRKDWSGRFKLLARGGFLVEAEFAPQRRIVHARIVCQRGGLLRVANPFGPCRLVRTGQTEEIVNDPTITVVTAKGETIELAWPASGLPVP